MHEVGQTLVGGVESPHLVLESGDFLGEEVQHIVDADLNGIVMLGELDLLLFIDGIDFLKHALDV